MSKAKYKKEMRNRELIGLRATASKNHSSIPGVLEGQYFEEAKHMRE
jgi:hypothetical protein